MKIKRRETRIIKIGNVRIGAGYPVAIQSMAKAKTSDIQSVLKQLHELKAAGCEICRLAVKDKEDALAIKAIKRQAKLPLVADIHFDWQLALIAINSGVDKIRLNPGNIYKRAQVEAIAAAAKAHHIPIRVGLNSGSLPGTKHLAPNTRIADRMVRACLDYIKILEKQRFHDIVISLKASNIFDTVEAYRKMSRACDYPFHLGVTATGLPAGGAIKSSIAIGSLLLDGIGDTIRVSLTDVPQEEVRVAKSILEALSLRRFGPEIISCPTCGRCEVDLIKVVKDLERKLPAISHELLNRPLKVAVMGCVVNGPGEAKEADIGIAFGKKDGLLFKKGKPIKKIRFNDCVSVLLKEMR
ncbi:MAG: flavodoxin-dependent (E)-4-hydroxy-3-methylbut-2-enyl-diphosphate synthase [Candidatus Omnitrophota bacterium]